MIDWYIGFVLTKNDPRLFECYCYFVFLDVPEAKYKAAKLLVPSFSSSDSAFGMEMFKRMLQTGHPTMLSWVSKLSSYLHSAQFVS